MSGQVFLVRSFVVREFRFEVQQSNSFSLQRSEMSIATSAHPKDLASFRSENGSGTIAEAGKGDCAPTELKSEEETSKL